MDLGPLPGKFFQNTFNRVLLANMPTGTSRSICVARDIFSDEFSGVSNGSHCSPGSLAPGWGEGGRGVVGISLLGNKEFLGFVVSRFLGFLVCGVLVSWL